MFAVDPFFIAQKESDAMAVSAPTSTLLTRYLAQLNGAPINSASAAVYAMLDHIATVSPSVARTIIAELRDQRDNIKLIASENFSSLAVQVAQGNWLTDKYADGSPAHRFYSGCDNVDSIETEAAQLACALFGADHAYVQPHSGADANLVAFLAILSAKIEAPILEKFGVTDPKNLSREDWATVRAAFHNQRLFALD